MRIRWIRLCRWLLGMLGIEASISSCHLFYPLYGPASDTYQLISGKVIDSETGEAVAGIEVRQQNYSSSIDTSRVDGSFCLPSWEETSGFKFSLRDIDPNKDGHYKRDTVVVKFRENIDDPQKEYYWSSETKELILKVEKEKGET